MLIPCSKPWECRKTAHCSPKRKGSFVTLGWRDFPNFRCNGEESGSFLPLDIHKNLNDGPCARQSKVSFPQYTLQNPQRNLLSKTNRGGGWNVTAHHGRSCNSVVSTWPNYLSKDFCLRTCIINSIWPNEYYYDNNIIILCTISRFGAFTLGFRSTEIF